MKYKAIYSFMLIAIFTLTSYASASAQMVDSSEYVSIIGKIQQRDHVSEGIVQVRQSSAINHMLEQHALSNQHSQSMDGYRIRIYRDNNQNARARSESIMGRFRENYPGIGVYRSYDAPYFKVTVGDFRSVDEANKFQKQIAREHGSEYANTYIVSEKIFFPPIGNEQPVEIIDLPEDNE